MKKRTDTMMMWRSLKVMTVGEGSLASMYWMSHVHCRIPRGTRIQNSPMVTEIIRWLPERRGRVDLRIRTEALSGMTKMFSIPFWVVVKHMYTTVKAHWADTLRSGHTIICKLYSFF